MSLIYDEYGRPFIIIKVRGARLRWWPTAHLSAVPCMIDLRLHSQEGEKKTRIKGIEAVKASILAAKTVARTCRSSLGPKGMDKMLQSPDGDVTISESEIVKIWPEGLDASSRYCHFKPQAISLLAAALLNAHATMQQTTALPSLR
jgi:hypothetical protein